MIEELTIKDFALIDAVSISFTDGFTVFSGETGAGKSIMIGAISFLLGAKADMDSIRTGAHEAQVSGTFVLSPESAEAREWLGSRGIEAENNRVLLRRIIRDNGKTGAWISGIPVVRAELQEFAAFLADIHGQHDHQSLLRVSEHRKFLDSYAGLTAEVASFSQDYALLLGKRKERDLLNSNDAKREEKIEMLQFAVSEIEEAKFQPNESEELEAEESRLSQFEKLFAHIDEAQKLLGDEILPHAKRLSAVLENAGTFDKPVEELQKRFESSFYEMGDIADELRAYADALVFDPERLNFVEERLALIFKLNKKYGTKNTAELNEYAENAKKELAVMSQGSENLDELIRFIEQKEKELYAQAVAISGKRKTAAGRMSEHVAQVLAKLGMAGSRFSVQIVEKESDAAEQRCGQYGIDNIEFLISANEGSPEKPLAKIASGGEISRVMLALKTVLSAQDTVGTLIFDEIDTGIGGEVANAVGAHLEYISKTHQVLCITHLASIAVCAKNHLKIEKASADGRTKTALAALSGETRVAEIARMLAGDSASAESLGHARSLLSQHNFELQ
ncbi:MAG: DNA repair protein RecN [Treponemataceae bacterium]|nr:MAG: DNA repair protein RecN [Treponemataceae bacterium]